MNLGVRFNYKSQDLWKLRGRNFASAIKVSIMKSKEEKLLRYISEQKIFLNYRSGDIKIIAATEASN